VLLRLDSISVNPATMERARALPTLKVVRGSRFGGCGGRPDNFLGKVEYWRLLLLPVTAYSLVDGIVVPGLMAEQTVMVTRLPDRRMESTTVSCDA